VFWAEEPRIELGPPGEAFEVGERAPDLLVGKLVIRADRARFWELLDQTADASGHQPFKVSDHITEASLMFESPAQPRFEHEVVSRVERWRRGPLVLWLYTPVVVNFIELLRPDLVVYDAMDELSAFKFPPPRLLEQEGELLERADLVLAGGPSIHEAKLAHRPDAHLFPSGVDARHFARALEADLAIPPDLAPLPRPVIGFFGVVDERSDLALLARAAELRPDWSWVMIGPVLKLQERDLPRRPNLHYLGQRPYSELPAHLKGFDVAMMPFARNEATRFISPTKTLEYMAAHKPIVSTPIRDVVALYGSVVRIADTAEGFVAEVEAALNENEEEGQARRARELALLAEHSWDSIAKRMYGLVETALARKGRAVER
jgi:UDP-galactopyranose mutase